MRQSIERIHVRVVGCQKVVAPTCCLDSKVLVVRVPIKDVGYSEPETDDASPLLGKAKMACNIKMFMQ